ncbi:MAG TPA: hypothetical protein VJ698_06170 [Noviherbaspirillum sp.]|uniref:hypothetical protein n=1 Tax=Noviherbaspirillum sp. TaxID=1926288 RepID=UPI002B468749|nr:hypothetical protein [Noviherbaspirillum sp.]HJV85042.1 hypothetical protein [Noviherbaspirillum sp.]
MSPTPHANSTFRTASRWAAISAVVIILTWCLVIGWWQSTQRVITTADTLAYLIALPLMLLLCVFVASKLHGTVKHSQPPSAGGATTTSPTEAEDVRPGTSTGSALPILATWAATCLAPDQEGFVEQLIAQRSRPNPDHTLTDTQGFPVLAGRALNLDTEAIDQNLRQLLAARKADPDNEHWRDSLTRALALLESLLNQVLTDWPLPGSAAENASVPSGMAPILRGSSGLTAPDGDFLQLHVILLVPTDFPAPERLLAEEFVAQRLALLSCPGERTFNVITAMDDTSALAAADEFRRTSLHDTVPRALLLLACDSRLCPTVIEDLENQQKLFDSARPDGLMVGEAAFGALFSNQKALQMTGIEAACALTPVFRTQRPHSADAPARPSCQALQQTVGAALEASGIASAQLGAVACDADHRASRTLESIAVMSAHTPQLDAIRHRLATNEACGHLGTTSVPALLVAGVTRCADAGHPVLLFNVSHDLDRAAAVLIPAAARITRGETDLPHVA